LNSSKSIKADSSVFPKLPQHTLVRSSHYVKLARNFPLQFSEFFLQLNLSFTGVSARTSSQISFMRCAKIRDYRSRSTRIAKS